MHFINFLLGIKHSANNHGLNRPSKIKTFRAEPTTNSFLFMSEAHPANLKFTENSIVLIFPYKFNYHI